MKIMISFPRTTSRDAGQSRALGLVFQTQPVGPALHGHVELNLEPTQLPVLQLIRRCFQWVRCWRRALATANRDLQPDSNLHSPQQVQRCVFYAEQTTFINIGRSSVFSSFISLSIVLFFPVNKNDFILLN